MAIEKTLKSAIVAMPEAEKDKLLLKLVAKDNNLVAQLTFQLLEEGDTIEERREQLRKSIKNALHYDPGTPGWLMMDLRAVSGAITQHVKITKDTLGEIELTLKLINDAYERYPKYFEKYTDKSENLLFYVSKKAEGIFKKVKKLHPDIQFEFLDALNTTLANLYKSGAAAIARSLELPKVYETP